MDTTEHTYVRDDRDHDDDHYAVTTVEVFCTTCKLVISIHPPRTDNLHRGDAARASSVHDLEHRERPANPSAAATYDRLVSQGLWPTTAAEVAEDQVPAESP